MDIKCITGDREATVLSTEDGATAARHGRVLGAIISLADAFPHRTTPANRTHDGPAWLIDGICIP